MAQYNKENIVYGKLNENVYKYSLFLSLALQPNAENHIVLDKVNYNNAVFDKLKKDISNYLNDIRVAIATKRNNIVREQRKFAVLAKEEGDKKKKFISTGGDTQDSGEYFEEDNSLTNEDFEGIKSGHKKESTLTRLIHMQRLPEAYEVLDIKCSNVLKIISKETLNLKDAEKAIYDLAYITQTSAQKALLSIDILPINKFSESAKSAVSFISNIDNKIKDELYTVSRRISQNIGAGTIEILDGENRLNENIFKNLDPHKYSDLLKIYNKVINNISLKCTNEKHTAMFYKALKKAKENNKLPQGLVNEKDIKEINLYLKQLNYFLSMPTEDYNRYEIQKCETAGVLPPLNLIHKIEDYYDTESKMALQDDFESYIYKASVNRNGNPVPSSLQIAELERTKKYLCNYKLWQQMKADFMNYTSLISFDSIKKEYEKKGILSIKGLNKEDSHIFFNYAFLSRLEELPTSTVVRDELGLRSGYSLSSAINYYLATSTYIAQLSALPIDYTTSIGKSENIKKEINEKLREAKNIEKMLKEDISKFYTEHSAEEIKNKMEAVMKECKTSPAQYIAFKIEDNKVEELKKNFKDVLETLYINIDGRNDLYYKDFQNLLNDFFDTNENEKSNTLKNYEKEILETLFLSFGITDEDREVSEAEIQKSKNSLLDLFSTKDDAKKTVQNNVSPRILLGVLLKIEGCRKCFEKIVEDFDAKNNKKNLDIFNLAYSEIKENFYDYNSFVDNELVFAVLDKDVSSLEDYLKNKPLDNNLKFTLTELYSKTGLVYNYDQIFAIERIIANSPIYKDRELTEDDRKAIHDVTARMIIPVIEYNLNLASKENTKITNAYKTQSHLDRELEKIFGSQNEYRQINSLERSSGMYFSSEAMSSVLNNFVQDLNYLNKTVNLVKTGVLSVEQATASTQSILIKDNYTRIAEYKPLAEAPMDVAEQFKLMKDIDIAFKSKDKEVFDATLIQLKENNPLFDETIALQAFETNNERLLLLQTFPCEIGINTISNNKDFTNEMIFDTKNSLVCQFLNIAKTELASLKNIATEEVEKLSVGLDMMKGSAEEAASYAKAVMAATGLVDKHNMVPLFLKKSISNEEKAYRALDAFNSALIAFDVVNRNALLFGNSGNKFAANMDIGEIGRISKDLEKNKEQLDKIISTVSEPAIVQTTGMRGVGYSKNEIYEKMKQNHLEESDFCPLLSHIYENCNNSTLLLNHSSFSSSEYKRKKSKFSKIEARFKIHETDSSYYKDEEAKSEKIPIEVLSSEVNTKLSFGAAIKPNRKILAKRIIVLNNRYGRK